ncbi:MAG: histidine kinase [Phycisphaeraceae bacterium]|nr:MAG: histidine kinase [Phycisphaeraceae bacterium]
MTLETKLSLTDETIGDVQDLISINIDSAKGFQAAADRIENDAVASYFRECAAQRDAQASELKSIVSANAEEPTDSGTFKGTLHRWWLEARGTVQGGDTHAVLAETERGEDAIKGCYEKVLKQNPGNALSSVLHGQYANVKTRHDRIRDLRDQHA